MIALCLPLLSSRHRRHSRRRDGARGTAHAGACAPRCASAPIPTTCRSPTRRGEGFENRIAELVGQELHRPVEYTWWAQRRGFVRNTLNAGDCDLVVGTASGMEMLATTRPYYKSTYVFVSRRDRHLGIRSFDDPALRTLKIGVQLIGDDFANTPPAHALANRGMAKNIVGFTVYGDYREPNPPARIVDAVARGDVDVAVVWGPLAGYFAKQSRGAARRRAGEPAGRSAVSCRSCSTSRWACAAATRRSASSSTRSSSAASRRIDSISRRTACRSWASAHARTEDAD